MQRSFFHDALPIRRPWRPWVGPGSAPRHSVLQCARDREHGDIRILARALL